MVGVVETLAVVVVVLLNSAVAALLTRFFRVRMSTDWGSLVYAAVVTPVVLFPLTMALLVVLELVALTPNLGSPETVLAVTVGVPVAVGITFDYFWMPAPEEVELPESVP